MAQEFMIKPVTVALPTLGCKANRYDSDTLARALAALGYSIVPEGGCADVYIVNTCTVTGGADAKSRKICRRTLKLNPDATLIITGCYASLEPEKLGAMAGVAAVVPITEQARIPELLLRLRPPTVVAVAPTLHTSAERTRATVKVADGCNLSCAFCAVTLARGEVRSRPLPEVLAELRGLIAAGMPEIVLTGIRLDAYGIDVPGGPRLADLLDATRELGIPRLRLSSVEPLGVSQRLIDTLASHPSLCHHFHVCLQSGDDEILRGMRRGYTTEFYRKVIARVRAAMPDATFTTDIIVGFPGESEEAFAHTLELVEEVGFIGLHIFKFSPRPHTTAATMPGQIQESEKDTRAVRLLALQRRLFATHAATLQGQVVPVLAERGDEGLTPHYERVRAPFPAEIIGHTVPMRITGAGEEWVVGEIWSQT